MRDRRLPRYQKSQYHPTNTGNITIVDMPAPSQLAIATSALNRLVKEEASYHKELEQQSARIAKLEAGEGADDENVEYILRQHVCLDEIFLY